MVIKHSRTLIKAGLLLLMFALGITLVALLKSRPSPPPPPAVAAAVQTESETPSEVVTAYWSHALEGDIAGANKYWFKEIPKGQFLHLVEERDDRSWAAVISLRKLRLVGIEREASEADGSVSVTVKVRADGATSFTMYTRNTLKKIDGEWKIVSLDLTSRASVR